MNLQHRENAKYHTRITQLPNIKRTKKKSNEKMEEADTGQLSTKVFKEAYQLKC